MKFGSGTPESPLTPCMKVQMQFDAQYFKTNLVGHTHK